MTLINRRGLLAGMGAAGVVAATPAWAGPARKTPFFKRIGKSIGLQLYTMGDAPQKDLPGTLARLAKIGYREIELPGFYGRSAKDLRAVADKAGVRFTCTHLGLPGPFAQPGLNLMSPVNELADALHTLGIRQAVLPMPLLPADFKPTPGGDFRTILTQALQAAGPDNWKRQAALLNERAAALKPLGIDLGYHNHNMEFAPIGNTTGWDVLLAELDPKLVFIELDLGWVTAAGRDAATELGKLKGRVRMVHMKDVKPSTQTNFSLMQDPTEVGSGKLDWKRILPATVAAGVRNYYVEQEPPFEMDRFDAVKKSHDFLSRFVA
ncbi:sugar phosphate isomerase/epimerase family protein [Novosphingobium ovatum]|nr:sugar phosphate isomerase/epimerase [Novosphingobium ovatum]